LHATERDTDRVQQARSDDREQVTGYEVKRLIFVDESGLNIAMTRRFGRAAPGQRVADAVPKNFGKNISILGALSCRELEAVMTVEGATDAAVFRVYVSQVLVPALRPGDVVVMDNLNVHKVAGIQSAIEACGASLLFLPPYSPDWSPIEPCWSKLKTDLRGAKARTTPDLDGALTAAIDTITPADARGWFKHCGYALN
jgi:transposase